jgi:hypothetical protein
MKISSEQKADIVRRIQLKNLDGTWAETYGALAEEFGVSRCLISNIAKCAGLLRREGGCSKAHIPFGQALSAAGTAVGHVPRIAQQSRGDGGSPSH